MSECVYERFLLFMNAVADDLLEEALSVPKRKHAVLWGAWQLPPACASSSASCSGSHPPCRGAASPPPTWPGTAMNCPAGGRPRRKLRPAAQLQRNPHRPGGI